MSNVSVHRGSQKAIHTTNPIESVHRDFWKVTKGKSHFPDDMSLLKMLYLSGQELMRGWTMKVQNWNRILSELSIHFEERVSKYL